MKKNHQEHRSAPGTGRRMLISALGALTAFLIFATGLGAVCAQAGTAKTATRVIKAESEEDFAGETAKLVRQYRGMTTVTNGETTPYSSGRLIVRSKSGSKVNLSSYGAKTVIESGFGVSIVQFASGSAAKKAASSIKALPAVSYVEADDTAINVGDTKISQISFEGNPGDDESGEAGTGATGTDGFSFMETPPDFGDTGSTATGYERDTKGRDTTYDTSIKAGVSAASAKAMSWGASYMQADRYAAYIKTYINRSIKVAVIDSGVTPHERLNGRLATGMDFIDNDRNAADRNGHGTHVAGTIVDCTPGIKVYILPVRTMDASGMGNPSVVGNGIRYAVNAGAKVINLSLGGDSHYKYLEECITYAHNKGVTVVVAAGNENENTRYICPAHMSTPIVVSAIDESGKRAYFSNYGSSVDVAAPGVDVISCWMGGGYAIASGTSMAAPHISAVAAMYRLAHPSLTAAAVQKKVRTFIKDLGTKGTDQYYGRGVPRMLAEITPRKVALSRTTASVEINKKITLKATLTPSYAGQKKLTWSSSNSKVVSVSGGKLTAKKKGTATITVKTCNGRKATCKVTVTGIKPTSVSLSATSKTLRVGQTTRLTATVLPKNAESKKVSWKTSAPAVATVYGGTITAKKAGTATITAITANGKKRTCKVTVKAAAVSTSAKPGTVKVISQPEKESSASSAASLKASAALPETPDISPEDFAEPLRAAATEPETAAEAADAAASEASAESEATAEPEASAEPGASAEDNAADTPAEEEPAAESQTGGTVFLMEEAEARPDAGETIFPAEEAEAGAAAADPGPDETAYSTGESAEPPAEDFYAREAETPPSDQETFFIEPETDEGNNQAEPALLGTPQEFPGDQTGQEAGWDIPAGELLTDDQADPAFQDPNGLTPGGLFPAETDAADPAGPLFSDQDQSQQPEPLLPGQNQTQSPDNLFQEQIQTDSSDTLFQEQIQTDL
ncbi:MAG: hypothetical protein E7238_10245 [Sarcina sp.]|nr:hypothetical protein [Sarcina sp.]